MRSKFRAIERLPIVPKSNCLYDFIQHHGDFKRFCSESRFFSEITSRDFATTAMTANLETTHSLQLANFYNDQQRIRRPFQLACTATKTDA
jgi:hypothetical protein